MKTGQSTTQSPTLLFHYEGENTITLESDITDHYIEDNTAIQDQIALRPELITTHGFIGELNDVVPPVLEPLKFVADKLTVIEAYTPSLSTTALIAYNTAFQLYQVALEAENSVVAAWDTITGNTEGSQNKQQKMFQQFYGYWKKRNLFTVQTPWAIFQNMAIKTLRAIQDADTRVITDFDVTFKQMRFASTQLSTPAKSLNFQGRLTNQAASVVNMGTSTPVSDVSLASKLGL